MEQSQHIMLRGFYRPITGGEKESPDFAMRVIIIFEITLMFTKYTREEVLFFLAPYHDNEVDLCLNRMKNCV